MDPAEDSKSPAPYVSLNGEIVSAGEAVISVFDRGFAYGDALIETLKVIDGRPVFFPEHYARLAGGMDAAGMEPPPPEKELWRQSVDLARVNGVGGGRLRLQVTRGPGSPSEGPDPVEGVKPTVVITARESVGYPRQYYDQGMTCATVSGNRGAWASLKSGSMMPVVLARREAKAAGADEAIFTTAHGVLLEGGYSNIFFRIGGSFFTTPLQANILAGITRMKVTAIMEERGTPVVEKSVHPDDLGEGTAAAFLSSSLLGFCPVSRIDSLKLTPDRETVRSVNEALIELERKSASWEPA